MGMHPTLKASSKHKKQRSVLKRTERLKMMMDKEQWKPGDPVWNLPKIKTLKLKIKKEKAEKVAATAEGAAAVTPAPEAQAAAKTPAAAKTSAAAKTPAKGQDKK